MATYKSLSRVNTSLKVSSNSLFKKVPSNSLFSLPKTLQIPNSNSSFSFVRYNSTASSDYFPILRYPMKLDPIYFPYQFMIESIPKNNDTDKRSYIRWLLAASICFGASVDIRGKGYNYGLCDNSHKNFVYTWGSGINGQLGHGDYSGRPQPTMIEGLDLTNNEWITSCVAGKYHSGCISNKGKVFTWGRTQDNLLGHDTSALGASSIQSIPKVIEFLQDKNIKVIQIATGYNHMLALTDQGEVFSWGSNDVHQCGRSESQNEGDSNSIWSRRQVYNSMKVGKICGAIEKEKIIKVACGKNHSVALSENGGLFAWGSNREGQIGQKHDSFISSPIKLDTSKINGKISQISCGNTFTAVLTEKGELYTWGLDGYGQLGHGKQQHRIDEPKLIRNFSSHTIKKISCGDFHMGAINEIGEVFIWGYDRDGQCGNGDLIDKSLPNKVEALKAYKAKDLSCGGAHTAVILEDGRMFVFGRGQEGQLGRAGFVESIATYRSLPVEVKFPENFPLFLISVYCGGEHTLALVDMSEH